MVSSSSRVIGNFFEPYVDPINANSNQNSSREVKVESKNDQIIEKELSRFSKCKSASHYSTYINSMKQIIPKAIEILFSPGNALKQLTLISNGRLYVVTKSTNTINILSLTNYIIATGTRCVIFYVSEILINKPFVIKIPMDKKCGIPCGDAIDDLNREREILRFIYANYNKRRRHVQHYTGIECRYGQKLSVIYCPNENKIYPPDTKETPEPSFRVTGLIKIKYDENLYNILHELQKKNSKYELKVMYDACYQLLLGQVRLEKMKIWVVDIALTNIFVKLKGDYLQVDVADLAESQILSKSQSSRKPRYHANYIIREELKFLSETSSGDTYAGFAMKMLCFSIASVMYSVLIQRPALPYQLSKHCKHEYPDINRGLYLNKLKTSEFGYIKDSTHSIWLLMTQMLSFNANDRPKLSDCLIQYHSIMIKLAPDIAKRHQSEVDELLSK